MSLPVGGNLHLTSTCILVTGSGTSTCRIYFEQLKVTQTTLGGGQRQNMSVQEMWSQLHTEHRHL